LGSSNAHVAFVADGTNWILTAGAQDTGWITTSALLNSWGGFLYYRLVGNVVSINSSELGFGSNATEIFIMPPGFQRTSSFGGLNYFAAGMTNGTPFAAYVGIDSSGGITAFYDGTLFGFFFSISYQVD
jgi:hypothetical protein